MSTNKTQAQLSRKEVIEPQNNKSQSKQAEPQLNLKNSTENKKSLPQP